ncbi:MAG TPA: zinc-finger domain-containing protein [Devosiaceae bacterium]
MAHENVPHFHNTDGVARIEIGAREFQCIGALPPFDHPHVYLDMGGENEIICPYCSTHYVYNSKLKTGAADPVSAVYKPANV